MKFSINIEYEDSDSKKYIGVLIKTPLSKIDVRRILESMSRGTYHLDNKLAAFEIFNKIKSYEDFNIIGGILPNGEPSGVPFYQETFTFDVIDGFYLTEHKYIFSCDPFF